MGYQFFCSILKQGEETHRLKSEKGSGFWGLGRTHPTPHQNLYGVHPPTQSTPRNNYITSTHWHIHLTNLSFSSPQCKGFCFHYCAGHLLVHKRHSMGISFVWFERCYKPRQNIQWLPHLCKNRDYYLWIICWGHLRCRNCVCGKSWLECPFFVMFL